MRHSNFITTVLLIGIAGILSIHPLQAQDELDETDIRNMIEQNVVPTIQKTEVTGTPYFFEDFTTGSFEMFSGRKTADLTMNFNIYENRVEYRTGGQTFGVEPTNIRHFKLQKEGNTHLFKKGYESRRLDADQFVEVLTEGEVSFLIKHEVSFTEGGGNSSYGSATKQSKYSGNKRYYFQKGDDVIYLRRLNSRRVLRHLDDKKGVKQYVENNDLRMSNPDHIKQVVEYYNKK